MAVPLKKLEDQLKCSICLETYTDPKLLQCNHVYCKQCLDRLVVRDQLEHLSLTCPNCRQVTPVPADGVASLQSAFRENQLLEIVKEHKKATACAAERIETASTSPDNITVVCPDHGENEVKLYCETCEETICWECIMKGSKHHSHKYDKLDKAFERYKKEIMSSLQPLEKQLVTTEKVLRQLDACQDEISRQQADIEADICSTISQLQETLDTRKTELISQLHQLTKVKLKSLAAQRDQLETTQAQLGSCLVFLKENIQTGNQDQALLMKSTTVNQVKELTTTFQPDKLKPNTEADIIFSVQAHIKDEFRNCGEVYAAGLPDPSKCHLTDKLIDTVAVGEKYTAVLQLLNSGSQPCEVSIPSISCELISDITGTCTRGNIEKRENSQFAISYQSAIKGRHQLHIKSENQHIKGSPFTILSKSEELGTSLLTIGDVEAPEGIAVNQKGEIIVTESSKNCVTVFSPSGDRLLSFGTRGSSQGQFDHPTGVAVDADSNIFVADYSNSRIQKFTAQGKFVAFVGAEGGELLQFQNPFGIAHGGNDCVYVGNPIKDCIQILNSDTSHVEIFGKKGSDKGQFASPMHVACDSKGNVYVADSHNHRIQVFTAKGEFLRMFGRRGENRGELDQPWGIAIDSSDRVYVSELENHRVSVFTSEGQLLTTFGSKGSALGQFKRLSGVAVDSSGVVFVCDRSNNSIQLF